MSAALLAISSFAHAAGDTTSSTGTIDFDGTIVSTACSISGSTIKQSIALGEAKVSKMATANAKSAAVPFTIELDDCDTSAADTATLAFTGQADAADPTSLANLNTGTDGATNVAVQITDATDTVVPIDGTPDTGSALTLQDGTNIANFKAYMIATAAGATVGSVHSTATFVVTYA